MTLSGLERETLAELQAVTRAEARSAAVRCARVLASYINANPRLLFADTLPEAESGALRGCLTEYVAALRAGGTRPERVIVAVKELVRDAAMETGVDVRALMDAAVRWAIAAYFPAAAESGRRGSEEFENGAK